MLKMSEVKLVCERVEKNDYLKQAYPKRINLILDLEYVNEESGIDIEKLLAFDNENFFHDIYGIWYNFNRQTKTMENCFLPRCAK